jgi:hypothetical protein
MVFLFLFELVSIVLIRGVAYEAPPPFHTNKHPRILDIDPVFGAWHLPNTQFFMSFSCFAVMNYYNDYRARDRNYTNTDGHWSPKGNQLAAEILLKQL